MTVAPHTIEKMKEAIRKALSTEAGDLLRERLVNRFDDVLEGKIELEDSLKKTRIAIRIFIDQKLADHMDRELRQIAGLSD